MSSFSSRKLYLLPFDCWSVYIHRQFAITQHLTSSNMCLYILSMSYIASSIPELTYFFLFFSSPFVVLISATSNFATPVTTSCSNIFKIEYTLISFCSTQNICATNGLFFHSLSTIVTTIYLGEVPRKSKKLCNYNPLLGITCDRLHCKCYNFNRCTFYT